MFLDVRPKLQTKPFREIWAWSFCKVGVINVSLYIFQTVRRAHAVNAQHANVGPAG